MSLSDAQLLIWENPAAQFYATIPINITLKNPRTFHTPVSIGKDGTPFLFNMWALRNDNPGVPVTKVYPPFLIAANHSNADFPVTWTPTIGDLDSGIAQSGNHQLMWESCLDNPMQIPTKLAHGQGYSTGFVIKALPSTLSSSAPSATISSTSTASNTSDTIVSTTKSNNPKLVANGSRTTVISTLTSNTVLASSTAVALTAATSTGIGQPATIGLSVGCGILLAVVAMGMIFWFSYHREAKARAKVAQADYLPRAPPPTTHDKDERTQVDEPRTHRGSGPPEVAMHQDTRIYEAGDGRRSPRPAEMPS